MKTVHDDESCAELIATKTVRPREPQFVRQYETRAPAAVDGDGRQVRATIPRP